MMNRDDDDMEDLKLVSEQASHWWVILHGGSASPADHRDFGEWISRSPERIAAWLRTEQLMRSLKSGEVRWPDTPAEVLVREARSGPAEVVPLPCSFTARAGSSRRRAPPWIAVAASLAAVVLVAVATGWLFVHGPQEYRTAVGEQHSVVLEDGSLVTLNTASRIEVGMQEHRRLIRLLAGEALFQVARDERRPFDVIAGETTVRAVGTQFNVDRRATRTTVTVIEGRVAVSPGSAADAPKAAVTENSGAYAQGFSAAPVYLDAAERLVIEDSDVSAPEPVVNLAAATAWTQRRLVFERRPLGEVAEEFNRYNREPIEIDSLELSRQEVTGVFQANDPESFVAFLSNIEGVAVHTTDERGYVVTMQETDVR